MRKDDVKKNIADIAKTTGNLIKTGYNTLSDKAEHNRQMAAIANMNQQSAAAKTNANSPHPLILTPQQRSQVDPGGCYNNVPGQMSIILEPNQEVQISQHNINRMKSNGGQDYQNLVKEVMMEHVTNTCIPFLEIRKTLYDLWVVKAVSTADLNKPAETIVINSYLEFRYGLAIDDRFFNTHVKSALNSIWTTDINLIKFVRNCGFHSYDARLSNGILAIRIV